MTCSVQASMKSAIELYPKLLEQAASLWSRSFESFVNDKDVTSINPPLQILVVGVLDPHATSADALSGLKNQMATSCEKPNYDHVVKMHGTAFKKSLLFLNTFQGIVINPSDDENTRVETLVNKLAYLSSTGISKRGEVSYEGKKGGRDGGKRGKRNGKKKGTCVLC